MPANENAATLRPDRGRAIDVKESPRLQRLAMSWSYVARNRRRWRSTARSAERLAEAIRAELVEIGLTEPRLRHLGAAEIIEVEIPFRRESEGWAARILPWEFLLATATKPWRSGPTFIVRHLARQGRGRSSGHGAPKRLGFLQLAPGLEDRFSFADERRLVAEALGLAVADDLDDPTRDRVGAHLDESRPDVIHVMGVDNHEAADLLGLERVVGDREGEVRDGLPFAKPGGAGPHLAGAIDAARILVGKRRPRLIAFNVNHSAPRIAPLAVAEGSAAAIAIQDTFDDRAAELFFIDFYEAWKATGWDLLSAFQAAIERAKARADLRGSGIVLWSAESLVRPGWARQSPAPPTAEARTDTEVAQRLSCRIEPITDLNYSMLHNNRDLFKRFEVHAHDAGERADVDVEVALHVGADTFPYRATHALTGRVTSLAERIRVPLTSSLIRAVSEKFWTTLFTEVRFRGHVLERTTHRVSLLPADEWKDNETDGRWLPSFVLPRDPAVERIVELAERPLLALADRADAGFDGYQSVEGDDCSAVDAQVRAIWWAIVRDLALGYINPPPSYSDLAQRLRSPSQVLAAGRGTCIDLTLLLAACLEYVGIYPVVFLLTGHACPGYWRSEAAYEEEFLAVRDAPARGENAPAAATGGRAASSGPRDGYILGADAFDEVRQHVRAGTLVPLEAVHLTSHSGFAEAGQAGRENLARKRDFDMMLDIGLARTPACGITPLPIVPLAALREDAAPEAAR
jgi:hypothetical protein